MGSREADRKLWEEVDDEDGEEDGDGEDGEDGEGEWSSVTVTHGLFPICRTRRMIGAALHIFCTSRALLAMTLNDVKKMNGDRTCRNDIQFSTICLLTSSKPIIK